MAHGATLREIASGTLRRLFNTCARGRLGHLFLTEWAERPAEVAWAGSGVGFGCHWRRREVPEPDISRGSFLREAMGGSEGRCA